jgi:hypothetical protein
MVQNGSSFVPEQEGIEPHMKKGALFVGHSVEPDKRIIVGIQGSGVHTAVLTIDEAVIHIEQVLSVLAKLKKS